MFDVCRPPSTVIFSSLDQSSPKGSGLTVISKHFYGDNTHSFAEDANEWGTRQGASSNLGIYAKVTAANFIGGAKLGYEALTFLNGLYQCTNF